MSITHNGKEYGGTKVINYSAAPDYNRGVTVDNIQSGNYQATDNGFLFIQLQSQQSNPTKVSVIRSKTPITDTGTEIASIVISQYQYSETLTAQVMARDYYKLVIEGAGNSQVISCMFYPYASNVPIKLTEDISIGQVAGLEDELDGKQNAGNYATNTALNDGLATKQDKGNYFDKDADKLDLASKVANILGELHGGTGRNDGLARGIKNNQGFRTEDNWATQNTQCTDVFFWQTAESAKKGLPTTAGAMLSNVFTPDLKSFLAFNLSPITPELRIKGANSDWKKLAFDSDVKKLAAPTHYTTEAGHWVETLLSDGKVRLEGFGMSNSPASITLPKKVAAKYSDMIVGGIGTTSALSIFLEGGGTLEWYFTGILA